MIHFLITLLSSVYLLALGLLCHSHLLPTRYWWVSNLILIAPLWCLYIPAGVGLIYGVFFKRKYAALINIFSLVIVFLGIMGWNVPLSKWYHSASQSRVKVLTANLGDGANPRSFKEYIDRIQPDVIVLQEASDAMQQFLHGSLEGKWDVLFRYNNGIISRYKIVDSDVQTRDIFNGSGDFVIEYVLEGAHGALHLFNVHLETPRKGVEPILEEKWAGIHEMKRVTDLQEHESYVASKWVSRQKNVIVAGDFNMLAINPIYQTYWSDYRDAFSKVGVGFGYTKYTSWHGARIDHILTDQNWQVLDVDVGPDIGGDHRPLVAQLAFIGQPEHFPKQPDATTIKRSTSPDKVLLFEDFESKAKGVGAFLAEGASQQIDYFLGWKHSLKSKIETGAPQLILKLPFDNWSLEKYPRVQFSYRIPAEVPVAVRVLTRFDDWICLGGTASSECAHPKAKEYFQLQDDDQWHDIDINVNSSVKSVLGSINSIKEWQFFIPVNRYLGDQFWIDNFSISQE